jgi:hypothetical protein
MMYSDIPNLASSFGYTNASWTLKSDLTAEYVCRLLKHMDAHGFNACTPRKRDASLAEQPAIDLTSGYVQRARDVLPKQGSKRPWRLHQNYALDLLEFRFAAVEDGAMEFSKSAWHPSAATATLDNEEHDLAITFRSSDLREAKREQRG